MLLACVTVLYAQGSGDVETGAAWTVATFAGVTAIVSLLGTQLAKLVPYIGGHAWCKILVSVALGVAVRRCWRARRAVCRLAGSMTW